MKVINTDIPGLLILEPVIHGDARGYFFEAFNQKDFDEAV
ncbi:MAG: dTDP-4-dehydrorhamnose 3,5-epimerase family protein, partial [Bacteroidales bacterium]|nr:dTDP-4-dehydrorhamnose 3,5-epimerase family protein [Bacteroidales bacterium]